MSTSELLTHMEDIMDRKSSIFSKPTKRGLFSSLTIKTLILGGALCFAPGCFKVQTLMPDTIPAETHKQWVNGFFWGSVGGTVDAARYCGGRPVASVETKRSVGNYLIELVTLGIYTPSHVSVTCGQPRYPQYGGGYAVPAPAPYMAPAPYPVYPNPYGY
jgi:hypothetical protein